MMKGWIEIGQWEKRMEDKKTRTLELRKGAAPKVQKHSKADAPGTPGFKIAERLAHPAVALGLEQSQKFLDGHSGMADERTKSAHR